MNCIHTSSLNRLTISPFFPIILPTSCKKKKTNVLLITIHYNNSYFIIILCVLFIFYILFKIYQSTNKNNKYVTFITHYSDFEHNTTTQIIACFVYKFIIHRTCGSFICNHCIYNRYSNNKLTIAFCSRRS